MGNTASVNFKNNYVLEVEDKSIFIDDYSEIPFQNNFTSDIFNSADTLQKTLFTPESELVADIITDPLTFTTASSSNSAWADILIPLFNGSEETKPAHQQIFLHFARWLNDRSTACYQLQDTRMQQNTEKELEFIKDTIKSHQRADGAPLNIRNINEAINAAHNYSITETNCFTNSYESLNSLFFNELKTKLSAQLLCDSVEFGFFSNSISLLTECYIQAIKYCLERSPKDKIKSDFLKRYDKKCSCLNISSFTFAPFSNETNIGFVPIDCVAAASAKDSIHSNMVVSGRSVGFFNGSLIYEIDYGEIIEQGNRMTDHAHLPVGTFAVTQSGEHIVYVTKENGVKIKKFNTVDAPKEVKVNGAKKFSPPMVSDGKNIYCVTKKSIYVYTLENGEIVLKYKLSLNIGESTNCNTELDGFAPEGSKYPPTYLANGSVLSIIYLLAYNNDAYFYVSLNFSLIDGMLINDTPFELKYPITGMQYDPMSQKVFVQTKTTDKYIISCYDCFVGSSSLITGYTIKEQIERSAIKRSFGRISTVKNLADFLHQYITYIMFHVNGSSFRAFRNNRKYVKEVPLFVGKTTPEIIDELVEQVKEVTQLLQIQNDDKIFPKSDILMCAQNILMVLDYNLSNFECRARDASAQNEEQNGNSEQNMMFLTNIDSVLSSLVSFYRNQQLQSIKQTIAFVIIHGFRWLATASTNDWNNIFVEIWNSSTEAFQNWMLMSTFKLNAFPYIFQKSTMRQFFSPYFKMVVQQTRGLSGKIGRELIGKYLSSLMYEMRTIFTEFTVDFNAHQQSLIDSFQIFEGLIVESMLSIYSTHKNPEDYHQILHLFHKWMLLIKPFSKYSKISSMMVSVLSPLFNAMRGESLDKKSRKEMYKSDEQFISTCGTFFEFFSLYIDFVKSLFEGGDELSEAKEFTWLISSTSKSNLRPADITKMIPGCFTGQYKQQHLMKKGLSFRSIKVDMSKSQNKPQEKTQKDEGADKFIQELINKEEKEEPKLLMDFLYKKVTNPLNKRLTSEEKHIERVILAVFIKQLGLSGLVLQMVSDLKQPNPKIILNFMMKQIVDTIYRIRRTLKSIKQTTKTLMSEAEEHKIPFQPKSVEENYPKYLENFMKKCVFLIHIEPAIRFSAEESIDTFQDIKKKIDIFLTANESLEDFFNILKSAEAARSNFSTGIALIIDIISSKDIDVCVYEAVDLVSNSKAISAYVDSLGNISSDMLPNTQAYKFLTNLLSKACDFMSQAAVSKEAFNKMSIFYVTVLSSISKLMPEKMFESVKTLITNLSSHKELLHRTQFNSMVTFVVSYIFIFLQENGKWKESKVFQDLKSVILPDGFTNNTNITVATLCYNTGMHFDITSDQLFDMLRTGNPVRYHSVAVFLSGVLAKMTEKVPTILKIFDIIADITSGKPSFFFEQFPLLHDEGQFSASVVRTPGIITAGCLELIQLCRQFLKEKGEVGVLLEKVMNYILVLNMPDKSAKIESVFTEEERKQFSPFSHKKMLYAVFAILSNVMETFRQFSVMKDCASNTLYYIVRYEPKKNVYFGWKLPVTARSTITVIPFSSQIIPLPAVPFEPNMFPNYQYLIPHFVAALRGYDKVLTYSAEGCYFYALGALREYMPLPGFTKEFTKVFGPINIPKITYTSSIPMFRKVMRHHLANGGDGFFEQPPNTFQFSYASPSDIVHSSSYSITDTILACKDGIHAFITPTLSETERTYFMFFVQNNRRKVKVGFTSLSCEDGEGDSFLAQFEKNITVILGKEAVKINKPATQLYMFAFDPVLKVATLYTAPDFEPVQSMQFSTSQVSCWVMFYSKGQISYKLSNNITVMQKAANGENVVESAQKSSFHNMQISLVDHLETENPYEAIVGYPLKALTEGARSLNVTDIKSECYNEPLNIQPTAFDCSTNRARSTLCKGSSLFSTIQPDCVIDTICSNSDAAVIDNITGIRVTVDNEAERVFAPQQNCPVISPLFWGVIPADTLNFYSTGLTQHNRVEVLNELFIHCMCAPGASVADVMPQFNYDLHGLFHQFVSLLVFNERIVPSCLVDYDYDVLDPNTLPKDANQHMYHTAMHKILEYVLQSGLTTEFCTIWFSELKRRFSDSHYHSAVDGHSSAVVFTTDYIRDGVTVSRPDTTAWFVMKAAFDTNDDTIALVYDPRTKANVVLSNQVLAIKSSTLTLSSEGLGNSEKGLILAVPFHKLSNESLLGTFIDLAVSFKYFVKFISSHLSDLSKNESFTWRTQIYSMFIDAVIVHSPYFITFGELIIQFFCSVMPSGSADLYGTFLQRLNFLAAYIRPKAGTVLGNWLSDHESLWLERIILPLKSYFPEFVTQRELDEAMTLENRELHVPKPVFPWTINRNDKNMATYVTAVKRLLAPTNTLVGYPFYHLLTFWAVAQIRSPPCETKILSENVLSVKFKDYVPNTFYFEFKDRKYSDSYIVSRPGDGTGKVFKGDIATDGAKELYVKISGKWDELEFDVGSHDERNLDSFVEKYRAQFTSDLMLMLTKWSDKLDNTIINCFGYEQFSSDVININFDPSVLNISSLSGYSRAILYTRACLLILFNWMAFNYIIDVVNDPTLVPFKHCISTSYKVKMFNGLVNGGPSGTRPVLDINRKAAVDVREGISTNLNETIVAQIAHYYKPSTFRVFGDRPWSVAFKGESGVDAGGLARELVSEAARDLMSPNCGLVVPTPNFANNSGSNRYMFVPYPKPNVRNVEKRYIVAGALIAISIRSGIVEDYMFPPLVWKFFITENITIEDIFSIDHNYMTLIESLKEALKVCTTEEEFSSQFNLNFTIYGLSGEVHSLTTLGRKEKVTLSTAERFIALANEFKLNEMRPYLSLMKKGLWENLSVQIPKYLDATALEYSACGDPTISYDGLRSIVTFTGIADDQKEIFFRVIQKLTPEQRSDLLKFSTGRIRLPPAESVIKFTLTVDNNGGLIDKLPTSSTCFHALHWPRFTSFEKAYQMVLLAIEFTGTFENA